MCWWSPVRTMLNRRLRFTLRTRPGDKPPGRGGRGGTLFDTVKYTPLERCARLAFGRAWVVLCATHTARGGCAGTWDRRVAGSPLDTHGVYRPAPGTGNRRSLPRVSVSRVHTGPVPLEADVLYVIADSSRYCAPSACEFGLWNTVTCPIAKAQTCKHQPPNGVAWCGA